MFLCCDGACTAILNTFQCHPSSSLFPEWNNPIKRFTVLLINIILQRRRDGGHGGGRKCMQGEQTGDIDKFKHTWGPFRSQSAARVCFAEGKVSSASLCAHTHFKKEVLPRCNPHREHGLSSDIKGHGEAAGRKWHVSQAPGGVCIWKEDKEEQEVCLRVRKDEGLSKSEPVPDRRSPHSVTLHQPHFTRQIYLPGPSPSCHFHWKSLFSFSSSPLVTTAALTLWKGTVQVLLSWWCHAWSQISCSV